MTKPKLLIHSNAPWANTGYGQQVALIGPRLDPEYEVAISAFYGLEGARLSTEEFTVFPGWGQGFGNNALPGHAKRFFGEPRDGTILTLMDTWVLDYAMITAHNVAAWVPVDHDPVPPLVAQFFRETGAVPIAMTRFGQEQLQEFGALYCPHAVDMSVYRPRPREECREALKLPKDAFVFGCIGANKGWPSRKCLAQVIEAFSIFHERHSDSVLYMHTDAQGRCEGVNLLAVIEETGPKDDSILFADDYRYHFDPYSPLLMSKIYNAMDCLLAPSMGEGFGVPTVEANACGIPAIVSEFTASPEVLGAGWLIDGKRVWSKQNSWQFDPDIEDMLDAMRRAYALSEAERKQIAERAVSHASQYEIDKVVADHMLPSLAEARERFEGKPELEVVAA